MTKIFKPQREIDEEYFRLIALKKELLDRLEAIKVSLRPYQYSNPNIKKE